MRRLLSIARADLDDLLEGWAGFFLVLLLPAALLLFAGQLRTGTDPIRVLVTGVPAGAKAKDPKAARLQELVRALRQDTALQVSVQKETERDPLARLQRERHDLVLSYGEAESEDLSIYTAEIDPGRLSELDRTAAGILRTYALLRARSAASNTQEHEGPLLSGTWWTKFPLFEELFMLGVVPIDPLTEYYPAAADPALERLPDAMTLILCLVPFVLAAAGGGAESLSGPGRDGSWSRALLFLIGKCVVPSAAAALSFLWVVVLAQSFYELEVKAGIFRCLVFLAPALLASSLLGQLIAVLSRAALDRLAACAAYVLATFFLCGFVVPLAKSTAVIHWLSFLFPATLVRPMLGVWCFGGAFSWRLALPFGILLAEALVYGALGVLALSRRRFSKTVEPASVMA